MDMIRAFAGSIPVLGVCLGHQSIVEVFGGEVVRAGRSMHGKISPVEHDNRGVFAGAPQPLQVGPLPLADRQPESLPANARSHGAHAGRRDHGCASYGARRRRRAVPSRERADAGRPALMAKLPALPAAAAAGLRRQTMIDLRDTLERLLGRGDLTEAEAGELLVALTDAAVAPAWAAHCWRRCARKA